MEKRTTIIFKVSVMWDTEISIQTSKFECADLSTAKQYVRMMKHLHKDAFVRIYKLTTIAEPIDLGI